MVPTPLILFGENNPVLTTEFHNFAFSPAAVSAGSPPVVRRLFEVNSEPHTGARPSIRLFVGPELARCVHNFRRSMAHEV